VGTVTEIYDYLRLLFARAGIARCPDHGIALAAQTVSQMVDQILKMPEGSAVLLLAPMVIDRKGEHGEVFELLRGQGFVRARIDGRVHELDAVPKIDPKKKHTIEAVVDRLRIRPDAQQRLSESLETALKLSAGTARLAPYDAEKPAKASDEVLFSARQACPECGYSVATLEPKMFSFNSPAGACPSCDGLGLKDFFDPKRVVAYPHLSLAGGAIKSWDRKNSYYYALITAMARHYKFDPETPWEDLPKKAQQVMLFGSGNDEVEFRYLHGNGRSTKKKHRFEGIIPNLERRYKETDSLPVREELAKYLGSQPCPDCLGTRLNRTARNVFVGPHSLPQIAHLTVGDAKQLFGSLDVEGWRAEVAGKIVKEVGDRLRFLVDVGLDYLTLDRSAESLSGGEAQRIRLASQVGSGLTGVMYILDEPSIGLHQRDNARLLGTLKHLRDLGNTVLVVEHDEEAIRAADTVLDIGPGAGVHGGEVVAEGTPRDIEEHRDSLTGKYLSGRLKIALPALRTPFDPKRVIEVIGARGNNLKKVSAQFPLGLFTCVTGVSGSGKSTLVNDTLFAHANHELNGTIMDMAPCDEIRGLKEIDRIIDIDQSPIGRTPRSNPATYTGLFGPLRELFAEVPESRTRGYDAGRFSFNVKGGRCEACQGDGLIKVEMHFLPDVYVPCDVCHGQRYNRETLEIRWRGKNIHEVLEMNVEEALRLFQNVPGVGSRLQTLMDVGLTYIKLGQSATTLSGGEAQRVKLARELAKRSTGRTLYILDEPTTGLHFHDVAQLLDVLHRLRDEGNTIVVIEHNLDVIKTADWIIDLGPEGGAGGGIILATGTPEDVAKHPTSYTARYLDSLLEK
jgi:excinuclease ABC subunit A